MATPKENQIAREIRAARAYAGWSRDQLGKAIGVSGQTIGKWERGDFTRQPADGMLRAILDTTKLPERLTALADPPKPSVAARARDAAQRLNDTPGASPKSDDAPDEADGAP